MKCAKCNKNEGTVFVSKNINGVVSKTVLCMNCAKDTELKEMRTIETMMAKCMRSMLMPVSFRNSFWDPMEFDDDIFDMSNLLDVGALTNEQNETKKQIKDEKTNEEQKKELEKRLKKAVEEERYEDAAVIRDKMKEFKY